MKASTPQALKAHADSHRQSLTMDAIESKAHEWTRQFFANRNLTPSFDEYKNVMSQAVSHFNSQALRGAALS